MSLETLKERFEKVNKIRNSNYGRIDKIDKAVFDIEDIGELLKSYENLKEIEKSHQEENGKLRVELEQEKEKNKDLEEKLKIAVAMLTKGTYPEENEGDNDFDKYYISKDIIKDIQGRLFVQLGSYVRNEASPEQERIAGGINIINEILEEK